MSTMAGVLSDLTLNVSLFTLLATAVAPALAQDAACGDPSATKHALVIGNDYAGVEDLSGATDARAVADHLCQLGYAVSEPVLNADLSEMTTALELFEEKIRSAEVVVFYFSGHGFQINQKNYLLPYGATIDPQKPELPLDRVLAALTKAPLGASKLVFLDACSTSYQLSLRDGRRLGALPGYEDGLLKPDGVGSNQLLISFAAGPGEAALPGRKGELSHYTSALLRSIREPGLELRELLARVRNEVRGLSFATLQRLQQPEAYGLVRIPNPFYFRPPVKIELTAHEADDDLIVFLNGRLALNAKTGQSAPLELKARDNELVLMVANSNSYLDGQSWQRTEGWKYDALLTLAAGEAMCDGQPPSLRFRGGEEVPFKDGPRHGGAFTVAKVKLEVDPRSAKVCAQEFPDLWKKEPPAHAQDQRRLWDKAITDPLFTRSSTISGYMSIFETVKALLAALDPKTTDKLPDLSRIYAEVWGNEALRPYVTSCMEDHWQERLADLEASLADSLGGTVAKPFESFDRSLSRCVQEELAHHPGNPLAEEQPRVWTAFNQHPRKSASIGGTSP